MRVLPFILCLLWVGCSSTSVVKTMAHPLAGKTVAVVIQGYREEATVLAAKELEMELRAAGVLIVPEYQASVIAEFYIGPFTNDLLAGWVAAKAFIDFKDSTTRASLATIRSGGFVTPTISAHTSNLANEAKKLL